MKPSNETIERIRLRHPTLVREAAEAASARVKAERALAQALADCRRASVDYAAASRRVMTAQGLLNREDHRLATATACRNLAKTAFYADSNWRGGQYDAKNITDALVREALLREAMPPV